MKELKFDVQRLADFGGVAAVQRALIDDPEIEELDLSGYRFTEVCVTVLCVGLKQAKNLRALKMRHTMLQDACVGPILEALWNSEKIRLLEFSHNYLGFEAAGAIARFLGHTKTLRRLLWSNTSLAPGDIIVVAEAVRTNTTLELLDLRQNYRAFNDHVAHIIARTISENTTLRHLVFADRDFTESGLEILARAIESRPRLIKVTVWRHADDFEAPHRKQKARLGMLAVLAAPLSPLGGNVLRRFVQKDGDRAIMVRTLKWVLG